MGFFNKGNKPQNEPKKIVDINDSWAQAIPTLNMISSTIHVYDLKFNGLVINWEEFPCEITLKNNLSRVTVYKKSLDDTNPPNSFGYMAYYKNKEFSMHFVIYIGEEGYKNLLAILPHLDKYGVELMTNAVVEENELVSLSIDNKIPLRTAVFIVSP